MTEHADAQFKERTTVENELYAVIYPVLVNYESRGFNAHSRAQTIILQCTELMNDWIEKQTGSLPEGSEVGK